MKTKRYLFILPFLLILATGCVDLKGVHSYSGNSAEAMEKFDEIGFSFEQACKNDLTTIRISKILKDSAYIPISLEEMAINCSEARKADSAFNKIYLVTLKYLEGMEKLSSAEILVFDYDKFGDALTESELTNLNEDEINTIKKLASVVTRFATDIKRRNELKSIIKDANEPFQKLLDKLILIIDASTLSLETNLHAYHSNYSSMIEKGGVDFGEIPKTEKDSVKIRMAEQLYLLVLIEKLKAEEDFVQTRTRMLEQINLMKSYSKILSEIKKGHQALYDNIDKIHKEAIIEFIKEYVTEIEDLKTQFDNLNSED